MKRKIDVDLKKWKDSKNRMPLIVRGARQVGKSFTIERFGKNSFKNCLVVNFELNRSLKECFESLEPKEILKMLEIKTESRIEPGQTLLFLDEIQDCPNAIMALRYFKEKLPDLHVIAAGSLLEFALEQEDFSFPVGRIEFMYMQPLSFIEFLWALGKEQLASYLADVTWASPPKPMMHEELLKLIHQYFLVGGMPAPLKIFIETGSFLECQKHQSLLLQTYRNDFGKYAKQAQFKYLEQTFEHAPCLVGKHFKYSKVNPEMRSRDLKIALDKLCLAGLIYRIFRTSGETPLHPHINMNKFKLIFVDIGLLHQVCHFDLSKAWDRDFSLRYDGVLAEQFVGQELLAAHPTFEPKQLFFWERSEKSSSAEVDFLTQCHGHVIPIEVKVGRTGRLRSLRIFMSEKKLNVGMRLSDQPLAQNGDILSIPFYLASQLERLVASK